MKKFRLGLKKANDFVFHNKKRIIRTPARVIVSVLAVLLMPVLFLACLLITAYQGIHENFGDIRFIFVDLVRAIRKGALA